MADHQEMIHAAAAAAATGTSSHDWWSTAVSCSADQLPAGFSAGWSGPADGGNSSRSGNAASSESPGSNSFATGVSSVTFQESAGVPGPVAVTAVPQPAAGNFATDWSQPYYLDVSGFHGYMSSRNDQGHINAPSLTSPSSNNNAMMPQADSHDQNQQFLTNLGLDLLSSPTSPAAGFRSSSLLRSLTEPAAVAKPLPGFQQYQQQQMMNQAPGNIREALQFSNNDTTFWNTSPGIGAVEGGASLGTARQSLRQSSPAGLTNKSALEGAGDSSSIIARKANNDPTSIKKAKTGAPSPLPTFKVRKEKLGDRITALQQLVSPFGKTDTASVLHETIEYIKFLHEQVGSLSAPYLKNRQQVPHLKVSREGSEAAAAKGDLTGRGLCLVPISSTFAVASETPVDFWTPFGAAFR